MTVSINEEHHSIDVVPGPRTAVVLKAREELEIINDIEEVDKSFRRMGTVANIAYYAAVATRNHDLQLGTKQLGFTAIEICHAAYNTVQCYVITCGTVNETFHTAIMYLLENDYDRALRMISSLEGTAKECSDRTKDVIAKIDEACKNKMLSEETWEVIKKEKEEAKQFEKDQKKKELELQKLALEPAQIKEPTKSTGEMILSAVMDVAGAIGGAFANAPSAPKFLFSFASGLTRTVKNQEDDAKKKEAAERMRQEKALEKKAEAEKQKLQLNHELQELRRDIEVANKNNSCFNILGGELLKIKTDLEVMKSFFEELLLFCQAIKTSEAQTMGSMAPGQPAEGREVTKVNCRELFEEIGFKEQLVNYMAKWVAIKEACLVCRNTLKKTKRELHEHIEKNPTEDEAWRDIDSMIADIKNM